MGGIVSKRRKEKEKQEQEKKKAEEKTKQEQAVTADQLEFQLKLIPPEGLSRNVPPIFLENVNPSESVRETFNKAAGLKGLPEGWRPIAFQKGDTRLRLEIPEAISVTVTAEPSSYSEGDLRINEDEPFITFANEYYKILHVRLPTALSYIFTRIARE